MTLKYCVVFFSFKCYNYKKIRGVVLDRIQEATILLTKYAINDEKGQKIDYTTDQLREIYYFSKKHDIAHIVAYGLKINDSIPNDETGKLFNDEIFKAYFRYQQTISTNENIFKLLDEAKIDYIPLKGAIIREYYPEPWMRTSSDTDILVKEININKAVECITKTTDFVSDIESNYDVSLISKKLHQHIELHFSLIDDRFENVTIPLDNIWEKAIKIDSHRYSLSTEQFLYFHYLHMAKHFRSTGFGIRFVLDTYILKNKIKFDIENSKAFRDGNLVTFSKAINALSENWFGNTETNAELSDLSDYILQSGIYGKTENRVKNLNISKFRYIIFRIFMPYDKMIFSYPILKKIKILLPFCWILRWFNLLGKGKAKSSINEIKINFNTNNEQKNKFQEMISKYNLPK